MSSFAVSSMASPTTAPMADVLTHPKTYTSKITAESTVRHDTRTLNLSTLIKEHKTASHRLLMLDYDGTLTPIVKNPADAQPTAALLRYLAALCKDPLNTVWIISGRDQDFLQTHLGHIERLGLSAEHGSFMKLAGTHEWIDMLEDADMSWKDTCLKIFEKYTAQTPGTVIEQKKSSITWHYRNALDQEEA
ncbi:trehalose-phosphatase-domain-containing protein [Spinellus fusiger]|nr:trehalose-phosphatase-domain-containing protein [Spinellus fusiger]